MLYDEQVVPVSPMADSLKELLELEAACPEQAAPTDWPSYIRYQPSLEWSFGRKAEDSIRSRLARPLPAPLVRIRQVGSAHPAAIALAESVAEKAAEKATANKVDKAGAGFAAAFGKVGVGAPATEQPLPLAEAAPPVAYGLFATSPLPVGLWVCDYGGIVKRQKK